MAPVRAQSQFRVVVRRDDHPCVRTRARDAGAGRGRSAERGAAAGSGSDRPNRAPARHLRGRISARCRVDRLGAPLAKHPLSSDARRCLILWERWCPARLSRRQSAHIATRLAFIEQDCASSGRCRPQEGRGRDPCTRRLLSCRDRRAHGMSRVWAARTHHERGLFRLGSPRRLGLVHVAESGHHRRGLNDAGRPQRGAASRP